MLRWLSSDNGVSMKVDALEVLGTNVMIADNNLNITYMNPTVIALMREAEADLRVELPAFRVDRLVGSNIDAFHKNPSYQRKMLAALDKPHRAMIQVGKRSFDLLVTPLIKNGTRSGFVVEWSDAKQRLQNLDYAGQVAAIAQSMAVIEFNLDGTVITANRKFLETMGYTLAEIQGKHHGMFVDEKYRASADYRELWAKLNRGEFQSAQFRRLGKGGKEIWLEASYNPILDKNGKPYKIIKLATDITRQVDLLGNFKGLIDKNFGEMESAVGRSAGQASQAAGAVRETTGNIQSMAASAEQLASSVHEIAAMMARSKAATDSAFSQTTAADAATQKLTATSNSMGDVVSLIRDIAGQINLLALNATIESARAGEAGKGFAVVASEVKSLARQAADATNKIAIEIEKLQAVSTEVVQALVNIGRSIDEIREFISGTASAVEEQSAVTQSMSSGMQTAAVNIAAINDNMSEISSAVSQVSEALSGTKSAAQVLVR